MTDPAPNPATPIVVPATPLSDQTATALRDLAKIVGTLLVTKGVMSQADATAYGEAAVGVVLVVAPLIWSQVKTRINWAQKAAMEPFAPDSVAVRQEPAK